MCKEDFDTRMSKRLIEYLERNIGKDAQQAKVLIQVNRYIRVIMGWKNIYE